MDTENTAISKAVSAAVEELLVVAELRAGQVLVVGCSTSEVQGRHIGTSGSEKVAVAILTALKETCDRSHVAVAIQCCEHLNRALVVERSIMEFYNLDEVSVVPVPGAGGALAAQAMQDFAQPVVVESIQAHAGMDIGLTLIGMHLKPVAVPVRLQQTFIGQARINAARTRPKLIGGARAVYQIPGCKE
ncbi:MAG: hypothetical protein H6Q74_1914 [Firmicutes bacterium]|nr:hypothetical protein [Bacillota bacterium]